MEIEYFPPGPFTNNQYFIFSFHVKYGVEIAWGAIKTGGTNELIFNRKYYFLFDIHIHIHIQSCPSVLIFHGILYWITTKRWTKRGQKTWIPFKAKENRILFKTLQLFLYHIQHSHMYAYTRWHTLKTPYGKQRNLCTNHMDNPFHVFHV